jgi:hypothetical protein
MMIPGSQRVPLEGITINRVNSNVIIFNSQGSANADCYVNCGNTGGSNEMDV